LYLIFVFWNISLNFVTKKESGVTQIFVGVLNIFLRLGAALVKSTAGIGTAVFVFSATADLESRQHHPNRVQSLLAPIFYV